MNIRNTQLLFPAVLFLFLQGVDSADAARAFTDRDLQRYESGSAKAGEGSRRTDGPEALWPGIETWLDLNEVENQIEQTIRERSRRVDELIRQREAERTQCTGIVGVEYWSGNSAYGYLVDATARKNCELLVERKYDTLIRDTMRAAEERLESLSLRKRELEARQRSLEGGFR